MQNQIQIQLKWTYKYNSNQKYKIQIHVNCIMYMAASRPHKPYKSRQIRGAELFPWKRRRNRPTSCLMGMALVFHTLPFFWPQESGLCLFRKHERPSAFSSPYVSASLVSRMKLPTPTSRDVFPLPRVFYCLTALQIFATNLVSKALNGTNICRPESLATITSLKGWIWIC